MIKNTTFILFFLLFLSQGQAQNTFIVNEGEIGVSGGLSHYFGDLNPNMGLKRPKVAFGVFYRKQFGDYVSMRVSGQYADVGYSDYISKNSLQRERNLSFNSDIYSVALRGDFNFFRFVPGSGAYRFTPFLSLGVGMFWYNPYTYLPFISGPVYLSQYQTEGQSRTLLRNNKPVPETIFPIGIGVKYNIKKNINIGFELTHNITNTDFLDDVSGNYLDPATVVSADPVYKRIRQALIDRSDPTRPYGQPGKMRGFGSNLKDTYVTAEVTLSISLSSYRCPKVY